MLAQRGSCSFATKATHASQANAAALLISSEAPGELPCVSHSLCLYKKITSCISQLLLDFLLLMLSLTCRQWVADCMYMDLNMTGAELAALLPVISITKEASIALQDAASKGAAVAVWMPQYSRFDFNAVFLWGMAICTFILAGLWAGNDLLSSDSFMTGLDDAEVDCQFLPCKMSAQSIKHIAICTYQQHKQRQKNHILCCCSS